MKSSLVARIFARPALRFANSSSQRTVVGSGWWCSQRRSRWALGDDVTRTPEFFALWHRQVLNALDPMAIFVTDSRSPRKPDFARFDRVTFVELDQNYGHANDIRVGDIKTKYCGFSRSVLMGAMFAISCDADRYVYVEQDCLLRGERFLEAALRNEPHDVFLGQRTVGGRGIENQVAAAMLQQSVMVVKKPALETFVCKLLAAPETDGQLSPEVKMERDLAPFGLLQVPYGRSRPIDFSLSHFYAQHLTRDELEQFLAVEGLRMSDWLAG